eukprot:g4634.t1
MMWMRALSSALGVASDSVFVLHFNGKKVSDRRLSVSLMSYSIEYQVVLDDAASMSRVKAVYNSSASAFTDELNKQMRADATAEMEVVFASEEPDFNKKLVGHVDPVSCTLAGHYCRDGEELRLQKGFTTKTDAANNQIGQRKCERGFCCNGAEPFTQPNWVVCIPGEEPQAAPGYWTTAEAWNSLGADTTMYRCQVAEACQNASAPYTCALGYTGPLCGVCSKNMRARFTRQGRKCVPCTGGSKAALFITLGVFALVCVAAMVWAYRKRRQLAARFKNFGFKQLVGFYGLVATMTMTFEIPWPSQFEEFTSSVQTAFVDFVSIADVLCTFNMDYYE